MKQLKLTLAILFLLMTNAIAAHDFEAKNDDGVTIYYNIISEKNKTVAVTLRQALRCVAASGDHALFCAPRKRLADNH